MATASPLNGDVDILRIVVDPDAPTFTPAIARGLLSLGFTDEQEREISRLLNKNNEGSLKPRESERLESYVRIGNLLNLIKAKARRSLSRKTSRK